MPASGEIRLVDANVWLAASADAHLHHARAKEWFDAQILRSCAFCRVTQMALLRHLTNAKIMGLNVQTQAEAWKTYDQLVNDGRVIFLAEPGTLETRFRSFAQASSPSHGIWTDAYLAAFAVENNAQLVTFDRGFSRFTGLDLLALI